MDEHRSVIVVGAGIIGLTTAWELVEEGWDVTLCDPEPGMGASRAAAGMLAAIAEVTWDQSALYPLMVASGRAWPELAARVEAAVGHPVGYLPVETLVCAGDAADRQALADLADLQHSLGMEIESITPSAARRLEPALGPGVVGAMRIPTDHQVDPRVFMAALLELLTPRATLVRRRVTALTRQDDRVVGVRLEDGTLLAADEVLVTAGLDAGAIEGLPPSLRLPLRPVRGDIIRVRVPERLRPLLTRTVRGIVHGFPVYLVPRADGTMVIGATSREDDLAGPSAGGIYQLLRDAQRLVPGVLECEVYEVLARPRPGSPDDVPLVGRLGPGLTLSTGYFRHGILLAALGARLAADLVAGRTPAPDVAAGVDPYRFSEVTA
ncbi:glycine oxidase [Raineyella antarctica]|uniref:glycine oxidase n=1 Tax=Raineyella antarctica TaxID=1577474 RepID=A0A1G6GDB9_9ACTN|nr:glycine oxidase ThiO [Raineyella antarctica]SDB79964.1 glycine oxidase [Raineyella antarctica]